MNGTRLAALLLCALIPWAGANAVGGEGDELPLPVAKKSILGKDGQTYYVEGTQKIPRGIEISVQKDVTIRARGKDAVLLVEGTLMVHGVTGKEVVFENVTVKLAPKFKEVHLDMCFFRQSGGVRVSRKEPVNGRVFIENTTFYAGTKLEVAANGNQVDIQRVTAAAPVRLWAKDPSPTSPQKIKWMIFHNTFNGGLYMNDGYDVTVRGNQIRGGECVFTDCKKLTIDANLIEVKLLEITATKSGYFNTAKMQKCDVKTGSIVLKAPPCERTPEKFVVDKCWFNGKTKPQTIRDTVFTDHDDDKKSGVRVHFKKIGKRPLNLAGSTR